MHKKSVKYFPLYVFEIVLAPDYGYRAVNRKAESTVPV
jgi:hypothetical protein